MEVLRKLARHVVVDDSLDSLDVQAAGREVSGHQEVDRATAKYCRVRRRYGMGVPRPGVSMSGHQLLV